MATTQGLLTPLKCGAFCSNSKLVNLTENFIIFGSFSDSDFYADFVKKK